MVPAARRRQYGALSRLGDPPVDDLDLIIDLHADGPRQGPGGADETRLALTLAGLPGRTDLRIADVGCGTGASTLVLAEALDATIVAVDFVPEFLARLADAAASHGVADRVTPLRASMRALPLPAASCDVIWSEGAIYNMGFEAGVAAWRQFLKPQGVLAVTELTWLTAERPAALQAHWAREYPEVDTAAGKMAVLERHGFSPVGYFPLPAHCWLDNYYRPMQQRFDGYLDRHGHSDAARALVQAERSEIALYERYRDYVGYGFYVARKVA